MTGTQGHTEQLTINAGNPAVEIKVFDHAFRLRASGSGRIETRLPTGFYTVRYSGADARDEKEITLRPGQPITLTEPPDLPFSSAAPMDLTSTSPAAHQESAHYLSTNNTHEIGTGSSLFFFVRDVEPGPDDKPARGLSLHNLDGTTVADLAQIASLGGTGPAFSAGRNVSLDPGSYLLRLALDSNRSVDMAVHLVRGWQSQVFLLRRGGGLTIHDQSLPDLPAATQLMTEAGLGFEPMRRVQRSPHDLEPWEDLRLAELARYALAEGRSDIAQEDLGAMFNGKWLDPLLGIFGLHLTLMASSPDLGFAESVLSRLRSIIPGRHPDVEVLALEIASKRNTIPELPPFEAPPMLRRSWESLVRLSACQPQLIPPQSLLDRISTRLWGRGTWLVWETPQAPQPSDAPLRTPSLIGSALEKAMTKVIKSAEKIDIGGLLSSTVADGPAPRSLPATSSSSLDDLAGNSQLLAELMQQLPGAPADSIASAIAEAIPMLRDKGYVVIKSSLERLAGELGNRLDELTSGPGLEELCSKAQLSQSERALLFYIVGQISLARWRKTTSTDPYALQMLVKQLDLPASQVALVAAGLVTKLAIALARDRQSSSSSAQ